MTENYQWMKPKVMGREWVLRRGDTDVARLTFDGMFTPSATVSAGSHEWTFKRTGVMKPVIAVRRIGEIATIAEATVRFGGSYDLVAGGRRFHWESTSLLRGEYAWTDENDTVLVRYLSSLSASRTIEVLDATPPELTLLLAILGGYLLVLQTADVATMTAILGASASV